MKIRECQLSQVFKYEDRLMIMTNADINNMSRRIAVDLITGEALSLHDDEAVKPVIVEINVKE